MEKKDLIYVIIGIVICAIFGLIFNMNLWGIIPSLFSGFIVSIWPQKMTEKVIHRWRPFINFAIGGAIMEIILLLDKIIIL